MSRPAWRTPVQYVEEMTEPVRADLDDEGGDEEDVVIAVDLSRDEPETEPSRARMHGDFIIDVDYPRE